MKKNKIVFILIIFIVLIIISIYLLYINYKQENTPDNLLKLPATTEDITSLTQEELNRGWYWGLKDQKKSGTPNNWDFTEAGRSSCWHKPETSCFSD